MSVEQTTQNNAASTNQHLKTCGHLFPIDNLIPSFHSGINATSLQEACLSNDAQHQTSETEMQELGSAREEHLGWCTVESDPALFNTLLCDAGVKNAQVEEVYSLDDTIQNCYGLIFLFRWKEEEGDDHDLEPSCPDGLWFANQVHDNCCASLAMLNIVFNRPEIELDDHLSSFKDFTMPMSSALRGFSMQNFEYLRRTHNAFARRSEMLQSDINLVEASQAKQSKVVEMEEENVFHFIAYVPTDGVIWELDGLKKRPLNIGQVTSDDWLSAVTPRIKSRMERYSESEVMFTLLAIVKKPLTCLLEEIEQTARSKLQVEEQLDSVDPAWRNEAVPIEADNRVRLENGNSNAMESPKSDLIRRHGELATEQCGLQKSLHYEQDKLDTYSDHAARIKRDYTPFLRRYIELLAEKGLVQDLV